MWVYHLRVVNMSFFSCFLKGLVDQRANTQELIMFTGSICQDSEWVTNYSCGQPCKFLHLLLPLPSFFSCYCNVISRRDHFDCFRFILPVCLHHCVLKKTCCHNSAVSFAPPLFSTPSPFPLFSNFISSLNFSPLVPHASPPFPSLLSSSNPPFPPNDRRHRAANMRWLTIPLCVCGNVSGNVFVCLSGSWLIRRLTLILPDRPV